MTTSGSPLSHRLHGLARTDTFDAKCLSVGYAFFSVIKVAGIGMKEMLSVSLNVNLRSNINNVYVSYECIIRIASLSSGISI